MADPVQILVDDRVPFGVQTAAQTCPGTVPACFDCGIFYLKHVTFIPYVFFKPEVRGFKMFWVKTTGYLVLVSIALLNQEQQPQREYTQAEKAVLTELCVTVTLDMLKQDELTKGEPCFFTHGDDKGKFVPFRESILKRINKQGINAYPTTAMVGKGEIDETSKRFRLGEPAFVLSENNQPGRLYIIKFKNYEENSARFQTSMLKKKGISSTYIYRLKKTGDAWEIESKDGRTNNCF
tara:strand:- start:8655 stop:9365 length:711 start_codon:yes stop_codon:yes gene_type:complete